jgi:hypothetical protein
MIHRDTVKTDAVEALIRKKYSNPSLFLPL